MFEISPEPEQDLSSLFAKNTIRRKTEGTDKKVPSASVQQFIKARSEINLGLKSIYSRRPLPTEERMDAEPLPEKEQESEDLAYFNQLFERNTILPRTQSGRVKRPLLPLDSDANDLPHSTRRTAEPPPNHEESRAPADGWLQPRADNPQDLSFNDLYYKHRKLQLHYSVCQILLKVGLALNAQLQEICNLIVEKFSLWQCHIFLLEGSTEESLSCAASFSKKHMEFLQSSSTWAVKVGSPGQLGQVLQERRDILSGHEMYNRYSLPISHQQDLMGIIDIYYAPAHMLTVEEQITLKTVAAQLSSYLEEYHKHERAQQMAITDGLTHLYNHRYFQQRFDEEMRLAQQKKTFLSLILVDIDFFKQVNDVHGHLQGDKVLQQVAAVIRKTLRTGDIAARYGGEEFAVLLANTSLETAEQVASRLRENIEAEEIKGSFETPLKVTASLGVAGLLAPEPSRREEIIAAADSCLYEAKENGRNQVRVHRALVSSQPLLEASATGKTENNSQFRWAEFFRKQEEQVKTEWLKQTQNYAVPEVTDAVWRIKPALSEFLIALAEVLDKRLSAEEFKQRELLPLRLTREIHDGSTELSLISFEMAVILLQESLKQVVQDGHFSERDTQWVGSAIDQLADQLNASLLQLFRHHPKHGS
ncbi:MAG: GGDEF domain-containing protein [Candidatus Sericytochromatia bacterium]|nr:GGDEF domain-containing protein [Candidatus Sericytochromatia bacterium]